MSKPRLIIVSGRPGSGKTTLAHEIAREIGCPCISRDELKQGMVYSHPGFRPVPGDKLTARTFGLFFDVLEQLLEAEVSHVAEAAFQHHLWRPHLERLAPLAEIQVIECTVDADSAAARLAARDQSTAIRRAAHVGLAPDSTPRPFVGISLPVPKLVVDTTRGYVPDLASILAFLNLPRLSN